MNNEFICIWFWFWTKLQEHHLSTLYVLHVNTRIFPLEGPQLARSLMTLLATGFAHTVPLKLAEDSGTFRIHQPGDTLPTPHPTIY